MSSSTRTQFEERDRQRKELTITIQAEIIPRLMLAHRVEPPPRIVHSAKVPEIEILDADAFVDRLLQPQIGKCLEHIAELRAHGIAIETLLLDLFAPAAHRLGALWETDEASFTEVTVGLTHLQQFVRELAPAFELEGHFQQVGHRAVLAPAPGEQHVFGLSILEEFFRRSGWDVLGPAEASGVDLFELVRNEFVAMVGFSVADPRSIPALKTLIQKLRSSSINPDLVVMVGGHCVLEDPSLVDSLGADATGRTAREAVNTANARLSEIAIMAAPQREA